VGSLTPAAFHYKEAQKHQEEERYKEATHRAFLAQAQQHYANVYTTEASKAYLDAYGQSRAAGRAKATKQAMSRELISRFLSLRRFGSGPLKNWRCLFDV
jgi:hypothetical protein